MNGGWACSQLCSHSTKNPFSATSAVSRFWDAGSKSMTMHWSHMPPQSTNPGRVRTGFVQGLRQVRPSSHDGSAPLTPPDNERNEAITLERAGASWSVNRAPALTPADETQLGLTLFGNCCSRQASMSSKNVT